MCNITTIRLDDVDVRELLDSCKSATDVNVAGCEATTLGSSAKAYILLND